jgi:N-acetylmuramoyl-L-alanine amidase
MSMQVRDHRLVGVEYSETPNLSRGTIRPDLGVIHYTAGGSLQGAVASLTDPESRASAHLVIDRDGTIVQLAPFDRRAWHAGQSSWRGGNDVNSFSVGVELVNWGWLRRDGLGIWRSWAGVAVDASRVIVSPHRNGGPELGWEIFDEAQIRAAAQAARAISAAYGLDADDWIGHDDVSPGRKTDPGPAWDWARFRGLLEGRDAQSQPDPDPYALLPAHLRDWMQDGGVRDLRNTAAEIAARNLQVEIGLKGDDVDAVLGPQTRQYLSRYLAEAARMAAEVVVLDSESDPPGWEQYDRSRGAEPLTKQNA